MKKEDVETSIDLIALEYQREVGKAALRAIEAISQIVSKGAAQGNVVAVTVALARSWFDGLPPDIQAGAILIANQLAECGFTSVDSAEAVDAVFERESAKCLDRAAGASRARD